MGVSSQLKDIYKEALKTTKNKTLALSRLSFYVFLGNKEIKQTEKFVYDNHIYLEAISSIVNYYYSEYSTLEEKRLFLYSIFKSNKETKKQLKLFLKEYYIDDIFLYSKFYENYLDEDIIDDNGQKRKFDLFDLCTNEEFTFKELKKDFLKMKSNEKSKYVRFLYKYDLKNNKEEVQELMNLKELTLNSEIKLNNEDIMNVLLFLNKYNIPKNKKNFSYAAERIFIAKNLKEFDNYVEEKERIKR